MTNYSKPRYIREAHIRSDVGILPMGRTKFREMIARGDLPKPALLIDKCSYWLESEVLDAIDRLAERQQASPPIHGNLKHQHNNAQAAK